jgi:hypothetical protein
MNLLGLLASVFVACGLTLLIELTDPRIHSEKELSFAIDAPTLASIPAVCDATELRTVVRRRMAIVFASSVLIALILLFIYLQRSAVMDGFGLRS